MKPTLTYVETLLRNLENELYVDHRKMAEIERLRFFEDQILISPEEQMSGVQVRIGSTSELIEKVKAAICTSLPVIEFEPATRDDEAVANAANRSQFWNRTLERKWADAYYEFVDSVVGLGKGFLKAVMSDWPTEPRGRLDGESDEDYNKRIKGLKQVWGPPIDTVAPHPRSMYYRTGKGNKLVENVEHSYKARPDVYRAFSINDSKELRTRDLASRLLNRDIEAIASRQDKEIVEIAQALAAEIGQPYPNVESLPAGVDTTTRTLMTEYWAPDCYQAYVDRRHIHECEDGSVAYFICLGRTSVSKDPDKQGFSIAEAFRHNEPTINKTLTRLMEAVELLVNQRLTIELPEGGMIEDETLTTPDGRSESRPKQYTFTADHAEALPPGAKVINPYQAVAGAFAALPILQMVMDIQSRQGVNPIFTGNSPGAGSGYRDTSLYAMAKSQFDYVVKQIAETVADLVRWAEYQTVYTLKRDMYIDELSLSPTEILKYPCRVKVTIQPTLPQNTIPEGQFLSSLNERGLIPDRIVLQKVVPDEDPVSLQREMLLDLLKKQLMPVLAADILMSVGAGGGISQALGGGGGPGGPNNPRGNQATTFRTSINQQDGRSAGGNMVTGQPRTPEMMAGATIQNNGGTPQ